MHQQGIEPWTIRARTRCQRTRGLVDDRRKRSHRIRERENGAADVLIDPRVCVERDVVHERAERRRETEIERQELRGRAILVRDRSYEAAGCVRITVGTREQTRQLLSALGEVWTA